MHGVIFITISRCAVVHLSGATSAGGDIYRRRLSVVDVPRLQTVGPNRPHLSFCTEPFGLEQRTMGIASAPQGMKQFMAVNGERACSARQAEQAQATRVVAAAALPRPVWPSCSSNSSSCFIRIRSWYYQRRSSIEAQ